MPFRILLAGLIVFGAFAVAGWIVSPGDFAARTAGGKGDRMVPAVEPAPGAPAPSDSFEPMPDAKRVRTTTIHRPPGDQRIETALLDPKASPAATPPAPPAREERRDPRKPFRCPRGTPEASAPPTTAQITQIGSALRLTPEQEKRWRPVQQALLEIARYFEGADQDERRTKSLLSVERMQQIYWMAGPLVMSLREEQKREARHLACTMGLAAVAALI